MLVSLAYIFIVALSLGAIFKRLNLPSLIGMLLCGVVLGPYTLNLIDDSLLNISIELRKIALVIILTRAGLALNIGDLRRVGRPAILMCFVPATLEILGMIAIAPPLLGITYLEAAVMGSVVAAVSPAVIVPKMLFLMENKIGTEKSIPQMIMAGASVDDVFVIVLFASFTSLASGGEFSPSSLSQIPISIAVGVLVGVLTGYLLNLFFRRFRMRDSVKLLIMLSVSFFTLHIEEILSGVVPMSGLLAIMTTGILLLRSYPLLAKRISPKFGKLWVAAEIILFVMVGASVDVGYAMEAGANGVILIFAVMIFRMLGVFISMLRTPLLFRERLFCMIAYLPKATVQAAIGSIPLAMGLPCGKIVLTVAVLSILITAPLGALGIDATYRKFLTKIDPESVD